MTVVNHDTGEIIETIGADEARRLTTEAQNEFRSSREHFDRAWSLIEQAVEGGGHLELGYRSPGDYLHQEFDGVLSGLDVPSRRIAVKTMTEWGLSTRAIAQPLGVSDITVRRDLGAPATYVAPQTSQDAPETPLADNGISESAETTEAEGPEPAPSFPPVAVQGTVAVQPEQGDGTTSPPAPSTPIVGRDGKTYQRPTPKPRALRPVDETEWNEQDRAEELARNLSRNLSLLYALTNPERRAEYIATWAAGTRELAPLGAEFITPQHMRDLSAALLDFASEWENHNG